MSEKGNAEPNFHDDEIIKDEIIRQLRKAFNNIPDLPSIFNIKPSGKRTIKMQGDQTIRLTDYEFLVAEALDCHFSDSNCGGVLICTHFISNTSSIFQFTCKKCHEVIEI